MRRYRVSVRWWRSFRWFKRLSIYTYAFGGAWQIGHLCIRVSPRLTRAERAALPDYTDCQYCNELAAQTRREP